MINTSPEPFSNWAASFGEDLAVGTVLWLAFAHPIAALVVLGLLVAADDLADPEGLALPPRGWSAGSSTAAATCAPPRPGCPTGNGPDV